MPRLIKHKTLKPKGEKMTETAIALVLKDGLNRIFLLSSIDK